MSQTKQCKAPVGVGIWPHPKLSRGQSNWMSQNKYYSLCSVKVTKSWVLKMQPKKQRHNNKPKGSKEQRESKNTLNKFICFNAMLYKT